MRSIRWGKGLHQCSGKKETVIGREGYVSDGAIGIIMVFHTPCVNEMK
jgi:hypothetical protein